jgi:hypothetical protein
MQPVYNLDCCLLLQLGVYRWVQEVCACVLGGWRLWSLWAIMGRRLTVSLGRHATVLQAEIYAILACVYEIQMNARSEHDISICSDSQAALKALWAAKKQCCHWYGSAKGCWMIYPPTTLWESCVHRHSGIWSVHQRVGPEPAFGGGGSLSLEAECKEKDLVLAQWPAHDNLAVYDQHSETGCSRTDLRH